MGLRIFNSVEALNAHRTLRATNQQLGRAMKRLLSGLRINRAADDAAGVAVSEIMRSQIRGMNVAARNAQDSVSMVQVAGAPRDRHHARPHLRRGAQGDRPQEIQDTILTLCAGRHARGGGVVMARTAGP